MRGIEEEDTCKKAGQNIIEREGERERDMQRMQQ
jgi:hypothetical protein